MIEMRLASIGWDCVYRLQGMRRSWTNSGPPPFASLVADLHEALLTAT